jgi:succinoglycan biosynthesis transport protein ExoP
VCIVKTIVLPPKGQMTQLATLNNTLPPSPSHADVDSGLTIADIARTLRSHLLLIVGCGAVCVACSLIYLYLTKPVYEAVATIRIDPERASSLGLNDLTGGGPPDVDSVLHTEMAVLKSDGVALRTLRSLPDDTFYRYTGTTKTAAALPESLEALSPDQQTFLNQLEADTDAKQVEGTALINVTVRSHNPNVSAKLVNDLAKAYTVQSFISRDNSVSELRKWLSAQMATLKTQVDTSQANLAAFQEAHNLLGTDGTGSTNTITDRLRLLNESLTASQANRIEKEARMRAAATGDPRALAVLFSDPSLTALQGAQGDLYSKAALLSSKFGPKYPPLLEIKQQLSTVTAQITSAVSVIRSRLKQEYDAAKANQDMLQAEYNEQTRLAYGANRNQAEYSVLQGEVTASRDLYDTLRHKLQQASVDADVNGLNTVLIDSARVPTIPVAPKKLLILIGSVLIGLFAGVVAAFLREASSDELKTTSQIERLGYVVLGVLPRDTARSVGLGRRSTQGAAIAETSLVTFQRPASQNAEAYRNVRNAILFSFPGERLKKLVVTSTLPGEGVGRTAANLSVSLAQAGYRVLTIDTDLRHPALHQAFGVENTSGLSDYLIDPSIPATLSQPLKDLPTLSLITAGSPISLPAERLASASFRTALEEWESRFDFVVLNAAPLLVVSDSFPLASWADAVLLVARYGVTRMASIAQVQTMLRHTEARIAGVLVDDVPPGEMDRNVQGRIANAYFA